MWTHRRSGQIHQRGKQDHRAPYERDATRVIHCPAFRRLQGKTQILGTDEGDFHRTRLTHSLEVASIGLSLVRNLRDNPLEGPILGLLPQDDLIRVLCLLHDIGHPPFGHGGETALNYCMREQGGFEGNAQTLRLLTKLENSYGSYGLDLTRRSLLGLLKYPVPHSKVASKMKDIGEKKPLRMNDWLPAKCYFDCEESEVAWLLSIFSDNDRHLFQSLLKDPSNKTHGQSKFYNLDCSIMDVADDIAYGVHDLEDAIHLRLISQDKLDTALFREQIRQTSLKEDEDRIIRQLFSQHLMDRKEAIGSLVNYFITAIHLVVTDVGFENALLKYNLCLIQEADDLLKTLQQVVYQHVIDSQEARTFEYGGQTVVSRLFEALSSNPRSLLDTKNRALYDEATDERDASRVICDYIANMTDGYAYRMHERLYGFNTRTIFERI